jgi:peptidoglycan-N-acetylglucosamine deacetylase
MLLTDAGQMATVLVALAVTEGKPSQIKVGNETSVPPPATELIAPARKAEPNATAPCGKSKGVMKSSLQRTVKCRMLGLNYMWGTCLFIIASAFALKAQGLKQVAITIDDLPHGGSGRVSSFPELQQFTKQFLAPLERARMPFIGFVNERNLDPAQLRSILDMWLDAGADLGNHTATHPDLNTTSLEKYEQDILMGETVTRAALEARGRRLRYFRHPFLHAGKDPETKRGLDQWLSAHGYTVAPVTLDNSDYMFAATYIAGKNKDRALAEYIPYIQSIVDVFDRRAIEVVGRRFPQILLIHASELNRDAMPALLDMFRKSGYKFVSLDEALKDPAYSQPDDYAGPKGFSWIHRWALTKHMPLKMEPDEPSFVRPHR